MGGAVSAGANNDELIDNLVEANYIDNKEIEEIFRAVDRGNYYLEEYRDSAYHDLAWRHDHLHISAPCIYSKVMMALELRPGLSFLNIGSGTGYLSTMVGLRLGSSGINHGIELYEDVVEYANRKLKEFILTCRCFDRYTFCEPQFVAGNCLHISPDAPGYDRIYCGAACPVEYESFMKNLLSIGGLLVMPFNDQLQVIKRTGQAHWESDSILVVNFANLVIPPDEDKDKVAQLPSRNPQSLCSLCRVCIRQVISKKYYSGTSNRRFKKRSASEELSDDEVDTPAKKFADKRDGDGKKEADDDDDDDNNDCPALLSDDEKTVFEMASSSGEESDESDNSDLFGRSSILNVLTGTVTTIGEQGDRSTSKRSTRSSGSKQSGSSSDKPREETSKQSRKKKKVDKDEGESSAKPKRPRKGWAYIRQRFRNRKKENSIFSSKEGSSSQQEQTDKQQSSSSEDVPSAVADEDSNEGRSDAERTRRLNRMQTISLLFGMTAHRGRSNRSDVTTMRDDFLNYIDRRRRMRQYSCHSDELDSRGPPEELPPPTNDFYDAILKLPLPDSVKQFILFYRTPN